MISSQRAGTLKKTCQWPINSRNSQVGISLGDTATVTFGNHLSNQNQPLKFMRHCIVLIHWLKVFFHRKKHPPAVLERKKVDHTSGQIIATSHDLTPNGGLVREIPLFQGNLGWWNIIIWPDTCTKKSWNKLSRFRTVWHGTRCLLYSKSHAGILGGRLAIQITIVAAIGYLLYIPESTKGLKFDHQKTHQT